MTKTEMLYEFAIMASCVMAATYIGYTGAMALFMEFM